MTRILYVAPFCHIPPIHGASQRGISLLLELARDREVTLLTYRKHDAVSLQEWSSAYGIAVRWLPDPPARPSGGLAQRVIARRPPGFSSHSPWAIAHAVDQAWVERGPFSTIYVATQLFGQAILLKRWPARLVLDLYDVYTPMTQARIAEAPPVRPYHWLFRLEAARVKRYEARILKHYDLILATSTQDVQYITRLSPESAVALVPNGVGLPPAIEPSVRQPTILMVASYTYAPNAEGFRWFYDKVWPFVHAHEPRTKLILVGEGSEALRLLTKDDDRIDWAGKVPSLQSYYAQASCVIVPIFSGGGTRLKLLEAMAWAVPVVSTSLGAQGVEHGGSIAIADTPEQFGSSVLQRLKHPADFSEQAQRAREVVADRYTWPHIGAVLRATIDQIGSC